jgi:proton-translocating NADH-quinone oxidoreductase chain L
MELAQQIPTMLMAAWLLPLASFALIVFFGKHMGKAGVKAGYVATGAIGGAFVLSMISLVAWLNSADSSHDEHHGHAAITQQAGPSPISEAAQHNAELPKVISGDWYTLVQIGDGESFAPLKLTIGYYIDSLTIAMFCMVSLIATLIHFYAQGYMQDELHDFTDHEVTLADGTHLKRPGRYHRFFQYLSLFCFSMLGLVISGNLAMTFVFWELVGICSYFLIGFYIERHSASTAANKAFIVNRVGDFGMIIGLMALWGSLGTFSFGDTKDDHGHISPGVFSQVRTKENNHRLETPTAMVAWAKSMGAEDPEECGYYLLIVAGLGIFCGCVGKSAQFPLHTWLPDAMEGPTPVSALVHSATMVAAGVFLVGRFYSVFTPEVLLAIAAAGTITLFMGATIAITATDIKRVLAYSTVSQLGYMMLALGVGGWFAGLFHLFTHAFFKSLLFMCSGSVIHAVHTNEMTEMGGLRKKMPYTAYTMLIGCLAIIGAGIPFVIGFSGFHSKDAIIAQALNFGQANANPLLSIFYYVAAGGAAITAFYMFRMWYMTFAGEPRNKERYDHAHESPKVMYVPLMILSVFAITVAWDVPGVSLNKLLEAARPAGILGEVEPAGEFALQRGQAAATIVVPDEHYPHHQHSHAIHNEANIVAFSTALAGFLLATMFYGWRKADPAEVKEQFAPIYRFLVKKWWFDELYDVVFVKPVHLISNLASWFDKNVLDWIVDHLAKWTVVVAKIDDLIDRLVIDGLVNLLARCTYSIGDSLRSVQTGQLRQYVVFIVISTVTLFVLATILLKYSMAG